MVNIVKIYQNVTKVIACIKIIYWWESRKNKRECEYEYCIKFLVIAYFSYTV